MFRKVANKHEINIKPKIFWKKHAITLKGIYILISGLYHNLFLVNFNVKNIYYKSNLQNSFEWKVYSVWRLLYS